jgi:hypothetical protein
MDGPLYVAFNTTTLWHFDAGEQGPSTSSFRGAAQLRTRNFSYLRRKSEAYSAKFSI